LIYRAAQRLGKDFFNEITKHMGRDQNGHEKKYTDEYIIEQGSKCDTPMDFKRKFPRLYERATTRKLSNRITYKEGYVYDSYTEESILKEASEYDSPISLIKENLKLYSAAQIRGLLPKIEYKIGYLGSRYSRLVYVYEFSDNHFYCGLTYNEHKRHLEHLLRENSPVGKHIKKTGLTPTKKIISNGYIHSDEARILEEDTRINYIENGWISLNKRKGGGLGTTQRIWTIEKIYEKVKNFETRNDLKNSGIFNAARHFGIYHDIVKHIPNSYSKYIILDTHTGIYYHSIQEAYNSSGYEQCVSGFGVHIKKNKTRYQIV
jgi:predicted GIY-YIG superfamily endonuclease